MGEPGKNKLPLRSLFKLGGIGAAALFAGGLADLMFARGFVTSHLIRAKNDPDYRQRLIDTIKQGRLDDKLRQEFEERVRPYDEICGLGEPLEYRENMLNKGFESYQVRQFITGGVQTENLLLVANIGSNGKIYHTQREPNDEKRLKQTMEDQGRCITIPSSYVSVRKIEGEFQYELESFSAYNDGGVTKTYSPDKIDNATGALVLFENGRVRVVDRPEIIDYQVGVNCQAIQSYGVAICSDTLEADLNSLEWTSYNTGGSAARSRDQNCFMLTLSDTETTREETVLVSIYRHMDQETGEFSGNEWNLGIAMEQTVGICEQLALERGYDRFVVVGPDPNRSHSIVNMPSNEEDLESFRRLVYWQDQVFNEDDVSIFAPPMFLGLSLEEDK